MSTPAPPYTRAFLVSYQKKSIKEQETQIFNEFVSNITTTILGAAKQGLRDYTIRGVPPSTTFEAVIAALKINFPDITIQIVDLPGPIRLTSVQAIYIAWG